MNEKRIGVEDFLRLEKSIPVLDVRSPGEYKAGHIPSAFSFPLFTDQERATVGILYKQHGRKPAFKKGLELVGPKLALLIDKAESFESPELALYCWRGGMRSDSISWLLEQYGFKTRVLKGGYKAYRNDLLNFFDQKLPLKVITGYTGSKKTVLLHLLKERGEQIIDLEGLANHQGSSFGNKKSTGQPTSEHFQNLVFEEFRRLNLTKRIWLEDECMRIGQVNLVEALYRQKSESPHIFLDIDKSQRVDFLVRDYGKLDRMKLVEATESIRKKLGTRNADEAIALILSGDLTGAADIILTYYDKKYFKSISSKEHLIQEHIKIDMNKLSQVADILAGKPAHAL